VSHSHANVVALHQITDNEPEITVEEGIVHVWDACRCVANDV
jgi:hypothetical protein